MLWQLYVVTLIKSLVSRTIFILIYDVLGAKNFVSWYYYNRLKKLGRQEFRSQGISLQLSAVAFNKIINMEFGAYDMLWPRTLSLGTTIIVLNRRNSDLKSCVHVFSGSQLPPSNHLSQEQRDIPCLLHMIAKDLGKTILARTWLWRSLARATKAPICWHHIVMRRGAGVMTGSISDLAQLSIYIYPDWPFWAKAFIPRIIWLSPKTLRLGKLLDVERRVSRKSDVRVTTWLTWWRFDNNDAHEKRGFNGKTQRLN